MCDTVEADEIAVLPDPITWRVGWFSSEIALVLWLQMGSLKTISTTRWNGQGPDSSLKRLWVFIWIHVYTVAALWTVTQSLECFRADFGPKISDHQFPDSLTLCRMKPGRDGT